MSTLTLHLSPSDEERILRLAARFGLSAEQAVLLAVEHANEAPEAPSPTAAALAGDLLGSLDGPPDLSSNSSYLDGYGASRSA